MPYLDIGKDITSTPIHILRVYAVNLTLKAEGCLLLSMKSTTIKREVFVSCLRSRL